MSFPRCGATTREGTPCGRYPAKGQPRCKLHGGGSPQAKRKAIERKAEAEIAAEVNAMAGGPVLDPVVWLQDVAGEIAAWLKVCRGRLAQAIDADEDGATIRLYERALGRAAEVAATMTKLGLDKVALDTHQTRIGEQQAAEFVALLTAVVARLDLTAEQAARVPEALAAAIDELAD